MTRDGVRPATWRPLCSPSSLPLLLLTSSSPQLLTTSGYTCSGEFRFQTERCLALFFCRTSIISRHIQYTVCQWPCGQGGEPLTACCTHTHLWNLTRSCFLPFLTLDSPHAHPYHHESRLENEKFPPLQATKFITSPHLCHAVTSRNPFLLQTHC